jgi:phosphoglycerate dehydrogenase-like enzyme
MGMTVHAYTLHARPTPALRRDRAWTPPGLGDPEGVLPAKWFSGGSAAELHAFLRSGLDLLVVAAPLTGGTRGLLGGEEFRVLWEGADGGGGAGERGGDGEADGREKEQGQGGGGEEDDNGKLKKVGRTFIANVARGPVIDTDALLHALNGGLIRGAALDVTDPEPLPDGHPLWGAKNVIITPHVSGASTRYFERVMAILEFNLGRLAEGVELVNRVDRGRGY